jgi:homoserine/homoserine lactone efflux protein
VIAAVATPGPAVLFCVTTSTNHGWKMAVISTMGNISGLLVLGIIAITGLGAVLDASVLIYSCFKYIGGGYLIYLGIKLFFFSESTEQIRQEVVQTEASPVKVYLQGLGIALSNPKAIIFLTALFPQFLHVELPLTPQFVELILTLMVFSFLFLMAYAFLACRTKTWLTKIGSRQFFNRVSGSIFMAFGVLLASSSKR